MARIRSIKPDFWTDEKIVELSPWERLLFIGLWNFADDYGYVDEKPRRIKMQIFPGDDFPAAEVEVMLHNLVKAGILDRYDSPLGPVLHVRHWERHQKVDRPSHPRFDLDSLVARRALDGTPNRIESDSEYSDDYRHPFGAPSESKDTKRNGQTTTSPDEQPHDSTSPIEPSTSRIEGSSASLDAEGKGREGKGRDKNSSTTPTKRSRTTDDPDFDRFWTAYPRKEAKAAARKAWKGAATKTTIDALVAAAEAYRNRTRHQEARFVAHAATWLNGERWLDETATKPTAGDATGGAFWDN